MSNPYHEEDELPERLLRDLGGAPDVDEADIRRFGVTHYATAHADVSEAELDVLRYASRGLTKEQIAAARGVSLSTVIESQPPLEGEVVEDAEIGF
jgi:DNA-binding NarL/FixJ family response regulator